MTSSKSPPLEEIFKKYVKALSFGEGWERYYLMICPLKYLLKKKARSSL